MAPPSRLCLHRCYRAKCILQAQKPVSAPKPKASLGVGDIEPCSSAKNHESIMGVIVATALSKEGFFALYRGLVPDLSRGVLSAAVMLAVKEKIQAVLRALLVGKP